MGKIVFRNHTLTSKPPSYQPFLVGKRLFQGSCQAVDVSGFKDQSIYIWNYQVRPASDVITYDYRFRRAQRFIDGESPGFFIPITRQDEEICGRVCSRHERLVLERCKEYSLHYRHSFAQCRFENAGAHKQQRKIRLVEFGKSAEQIKGSLFRLELS